MRRYFSGHLHERTTFTTELRDHVRIGRAQMRGESYEEFLKTRNISGAV